MEKKYTTNWRQAISRNIRKTNLVIALFILIYGAIGFLVDLVAHVGTYYDQFGRPIYLSCTDVAFGIFHGQIVPWGMIITAAIAVISVLITFSFHDKLMLLGTQYREITANGENSVEENRLYNTIDEMRIAAGMRYMPKVYLIEADFMNAFASGYSEKSALIAVSRGLLEKLTRSELEAVVAHELTHIRNSDIKLTLFVSILSNLMLMIVDLLFYNFYFSANNDRRERNDNVLLIVVILLRYFLPLLTAVLMFFLSRTREYMADAGSVELMRDNEPLAKALLKISGDYRANKKAVYQQKRTKHEEIRRAAYIFDDESSLFSTHPTLKQRLVSIGYNLAEDE